jgi:hypothetical protein
VNTYYLRCEPILFSEGGFYADKKTSVSKILYHGDSDKENHL